MALNLKNNENIDNQSSLIPLFPNANEILFYTGNTLQLFKLMKKTNPSITEELIDGISTILKHSKHETNESYVKFVLSSNDKSQTDQLKREDFKYSVKIFLRSLEPKILSHTIDTILNELNENYLENIIISLPNYGSNIKLNDFLPLWHVIEDNIDRKKILSAGVCDFMLPLLSDLCDRCKHKPYANQINLGVCCAIPDELNRYAKEHNIQLLTHNDPIDVINESNFQTTIRQYCHEYDSLNWKPLSITRYNSIIANRGIIKTKGFFIYAKRDLNSN